MGQRKLVFEHREGNPLFWQLLAFLIAIFSSLSMVALLLLAVGKDVFEAYEALFLGAFGGKEELLETLTRATPLIFTGLATVVAFRARIWSIGQEGQLIVGGIVAYIVSVNFQQLPTYILVPVLIISGFVGGASLGALCGWLKSRFSLDEIISTVMLNYVVIYLLSYLLSGPIMDPSAFYLQSETIVENSVFPVLIEDNRLHVGLIAAFISAVLVSILINKTPLGYDIRAFGFNPQASTYKGTNVPMMFVAVMLISGGLAGIAGAGEVFGIHGRVSMDLSAGLGYTGILVALIGGLKPIGTTVAAIMFGGLINGGFVMQVLVNVPLSIVYVLQGTLLLFFLCSSLLTKYQVSWVSSHE